MKKLEALFNVEIVLIIPLQIPGFIYLLMK